MIKNKRRLLMLIPIIFTIFTITLLFPSLAFAQEEDTTEEEIIEPEVLNFDINYSEVNAYGIIGEQFEFKVDVTLDAPEEQYFELEKDVPPGWSIKVSPGSLSVDVPGLKLKPGNKESLTIVCSPLVEQDPGEYIFSLTLKSTKEGKQLEESVEFKALVKSAGLLNLTTSTGRLSTDIGPGRDNLYILIIENTGTAPVEDISISTQQEPEGWLIELEDNIDILQVGEKMEIEANIIPPERTIAGDYSIRFLANSSEDNDSLDLRTAVKTPLIWRILGIALIAFVIAGIAIVFERLSRR